MKTTQLLAACAVILLIAAGCSNNNSQDNQSGQTSESTNQNQPSAEGEVGNNPEVDEGGNESVNEGVGEQDSVVAPISRAAERVTKKPFGLQVSPNNSPIQPERFSGYHTGVDFETFPEEKNSDVAINAICDGKLASKRNASGYGGLATQYCTIDGQAVTVVYGHMRLSSITAKVGEELKVGQNLGVLGTGFSSETDGERKHLHLGIVKGQGSDIRGYVTQQSLLGDFIDVMKYL